MRRYLPSLSALHAFEAAARYMNFTRAAEDMGLTQSGISRQIKNLEDFLGVKLFHRHGPRLVLTQVGADYYREVASSLDKLQEISIDAVRGRNLDSSVMIGTQPAFGSRWLLPRIGSFIRNNTDVPLEIAQVSGDVDFETTRLDVAILRGAGTWQHARSIELFAEQVAIIASPNLIDPAEKLGKTDFLKFPMIQNANRPSMWLHWLRLSEVDYVGTIQGPRFAHTDMVIQAAIHAIGVAVVPVSFVESELSRGDLHLPFGPPIASGDAYYAIYPERKAQLKSIVLMKDWLIRETRSLEKIDQ